MSVYTDLLRVGLPEESAQALADVAAQGIVTRQYLDLRMSELDVRLAQLESRLAWKIGGLIVTAMLGVTAIFGVIVSWLPR